MAIDSGIPAMLGRRERTCTDQEPCNGRIVFVFFVEMGLDNHKKGVSFFLGGRCGGSRF